MVKFFRAKLVAWWCHCDAYVFPMKNKTLYLALVVVITNFAPSQQFTEQEMIVHLQEYDRITRTYCNQQTHANWNVQTDVGNVTNEEKLLRVKVDYANYMKEQYDLHFRDAQIESYQSEDVKRQLMILKNIGTAALNEEDFNSLIETSTKMLGIFNSAKICPYNNRQCDSATQGLALDPIEEQLASLAATDGSYQEMQYLWEEWHEKSGKLMREEYRNLVDLNNKAAIANGLSDAGEMWRAQYEHDNFIQLIEKLWKEVEPLYNELHRYVRYQLLDIYSNDFSKADPLLPAHVFGNMWAENWGHLYKLTRPFKNVAEINVTSRMEERNYTVSRVYSISDEFYQSLDLPTSTMSYNPPSIIVQPNDSKINCHASAWDFCDGADFRIKYCTKINMEDLLVVHHEMGHIMYYSMYKNQPLIYRSGANPGFHEALSNAIDLSVATPKHLKRVLLLDNYDDTEADNINALYKMALQRVAFLPFGLLIDKWRWDVFSGQTPENEWNKHWWELREKYQKIRSTPTPRGEEFFDPGAKFHIPADSQYIANFVGHILGFTLYRSLCIAANDTSSKLHKCDFYNDRRPGLKLRAGLELGYSKHWSEAWNVLTDSPEISSSALREYFAPLYDFLKLENDKRQIADMPAMLNLYEREGSEMCNKYVHAEWAVATDSENEQLRDDYERVVLENAEFTRRWHESTFKGANPSNYSDELVQRQLKYLIRLGKDALEAEDLSELTNTQTSMENIYNFASVCPFTIQNCNISDRTVSLSLDPEISEIMAKSADYDELKWVWEQWHQVSGKHMREGYIKYVELNNKVADLNNFADAGKMWLQAYEDENFVAKVDAAWTDVEPIYKELQTYVRRKLKAIYGDKMDDSDDLIPAHILGNMWAQSWVNLYELIKPFPDGSSINVTDNMVLQNVSIQEMFKKSEDFFKGLDFPTINMSYINIINKAENGTCTCPAIAWDFCNGEDFRITMCMTVNQEDFVTAHSVMGKINYFSLNKDQPLVLRTGAHPGFHEAVGDLIALSVSTPQHFESIGYLQGYQDTEEDNINALFKMALEKIAFIPFGLLIDKWRWDVFSGAVEPSEWNKHWWDLRKHYQKIKPPTPRGEEFFDPGAKFDVLADVPYIQHFVSHILQFQLHRTACQVAGQYVPNNPAKPLHKCDIQGNAVAGSRIKAGLSYGLSKHWTESLLTMTNQSEMSGKALHEYFAPLYDWLKERNEEDEKNSSTTNRRNVFLLTIVTPICVSILILIMIIVFVFVHRRRLGLFNRYKIFKH